MQTIYDIITINYYLTRPSSKSAILIIYMSNPTLHNALAASISALYAGKQKLINTRFVEFYRNCKNNFLHNNNQQHFISTSIKVMIKMQTKIMTKKFSVPLTR